MRSTATALEQQQRETDDLRTKLQAEQGVTRELEQKVGQKRQEIDNLRAELESPRSEEATDDGWAHIEVRYVPRSARVSPSRIDFLRDICAGSWCNIVEARDKETGKRVAVKVFKHLADAPCRRLFVSEFVIPMAMRIRSVVKILGYTLPADGEQTGMVVMEFMENGTLNDAVPAQFAGRPKPRFGPTELSKAILGVAAAMEQLHAMGIAHRNLKPDKVLLDDNWEPRLAGFAMGESDKFSMDSGEGYPPSLFLGPELYGEDGDCISWQAADVYSFAVFVYVCLTPKQDELSDGPFRTAQNLERKVAEGCRLKRQPEIPGKYWDLIESCWRQNPRDGPTFADIIRDMRASCEYVIAGTDTGKYEEYRTRVCARVTGPLPTIEILTYICEKIIAESPGD
jgi:serine/threonine protein kinase